MMGGEVVETWSTSRSKRPIPDYVKKLASVKNKDLANARNLEEVLEEFGKFSEVAF